MFISDDAPCYAELDVDYRYQAHLYYQFICPGEDRRAAEAQAFIWMQDRARDYMRKSTRQRARFQVLMALQNHAPYRFGLDRETFLSRKRLMKERGAELAVALREEDVSAVKDILDELPNSTAQDILDRYEFLSDELLVCERCNSIEYRGVMSGVIVSLRTRDVEYWCESCTDDHAFCCNDCNEWFSNEMRREDSDGASICNGCFEENYFECDECGGTFSNDNYAGDGMCSDCYHDSGDDDDDSEDYDGLRDYHSSRRNFIAINRTPDKPFKRSPPLGLELEVYADGDRGEAVRGLKDFTRDSFPGEVLFERDGSLSDEQGFEIITDPLGYSEWREHGPRLIKALRDNDVVGWDATGGRYGIHLTVARSFLSPLQEARMLMFLAAEDNRDFVRAIAQRENVYGMTTVDRGLPGLGQLLSRYQKIAVLGGLSSRSKKIYGAGKYCPINYKTSLAEFRIFASTTNLVSFMKNIEFVYALLEWTRPEAATGSKWYCKDFLNWFKARPNARKDYANLIAYLERPKFHIKCHNAPSDTFVINNHWKEYLPRTTLETTSQPAETETTC